jgi:precorrin-6B methylase 2
MDEDGICFLKGIGIENDRMILGFGCGEGHYTIPAAKVAGEGGNVYALDKKRESLRELERIAKKENFIDL